MIHLYGIANCDTVRKARKWLDATDRQYLFHDYKKEGVDPAKLRHWAHKLGWEKLLNKRGTTFRKLDEGEKHDIDEAKAIALMVRHPSMIKRPVAEGDDALLIGFVPEDWEDAF